MVFNEQKNRGVLFGDGVFETMRVGKRGVWEEGAHVQRLTKALSFFGLKVDLKKIIQEISALRFEETCLVRLTVIRSGGPFSIQEQSRSEVYWSKRPLLVSTRAPRMIGLSGLYQPGDVLHEFKTTSFLRSVHCRMRSEDLGYDVGIMLGGEGEVGESATANIWAVFDDHVVTPTASGVLAGIARGSILRRSLGELPIFVRPLKVDELFDAKEIALSSVGGLVSARSFCFQDRDIELESNWAPAVAEVLFE